MSEHVHTVAGITALIRESLEDRFSGVWIEGEISNHRLPGSGHHYFTLKDPFAQLSCVFFKGAAMRCPVRLGDGMQVQVYGNLSVYEARGQYQLVAQAVHAKGFGDLQAKFEALKRKLEAEGLFDARPEMVCERVDVDEPDCCSDFDTAPVTVGVASPDIVGELAAE